MPHLLLGYNNFTMEPSTHPHTANIDSEALRMVGTMLRLVRSISRSYADVNTAEMTLADVTVLNLVFQGVDLPSLVAKELRLDPPRVTRITDHLVQLGLVNREDDPEDRRRSRLRVTEAGEDNLKVALAQVSTAVDEYLDEIKPEQRAALIDSMTALRSVIDRAAE
jgi:DNA-binding MarR family transcriptional regulator